MDSATAVFLRGKKWRRIYDKMVLNGFYEMVSDHYNDHMLNAGLTWENYGEKNVGGLSSAY